MKRLVLSSAVAAACGLLCGNASALAISGYTPGASDTLELRMSGASAQDIALEKAIALMCDSGTLNGITMTNQSFYYCSITGGATKEGVTVLSGVTQTKLAVWKMSTGGSGNGIAPVATAGSLAFLNVTAIAANTSYLSAGTNVTSSVLPTYTMQTVIGAGTSLTKNDVTQVGLSDVEPSLLSATATNIALLTRSEGAHLTFGIPVTKTLRNQLQQDQGLTIGSETEANVPSLSRVQIAAMMNGGITNFSQLSQNADTSLRVPSAPVNIAFRSATSGTTRVNNAYFGVDSGQCVLNAKARKSATSADATGAACSVNSTNQIVIQASGSDTVVTCLNNFENNTKAAFGILSMETSTAAGTAGEKVRFIKIDGQAPTLLNVANGKYGLWASVSYQYKSTLAAPALTAATSLKSLLAKDAVLKDVNLTISQSFGSAGDFGYLSAPTAARSLPVTSLASDLSSPWTKSVSGTQNNCLTGVKY